MAIVAYMSSEQITQITGYNYLAELQYGSNGDGWGAPELDAGTTGDRVSTSDTWEPYPEYGIDTGWLNATSTLKPGTGGLNHFANGAAEVLTFNTDAFGGISYIKIRAGVQNQAAMLWQNTQVKFYQDNVLQETLNLNPFGVDKSTVPGGGAGESIATVWPSSSGYNRVSVTTQFKMVAPAGIWLDGYDTLSQVFFYVNAGGGGSSGQNSSSSSSGTVLTSDATTPSTSGVFATAPLTSSESTVATEPAPDLLGGTDPSLLG